MNVGTTASMAMLMYARYVGGAAMLPESVGGKGFVAGQAHEILAPFVEPIAAAVLVIVLAVVAGGIGFLVTYSSRKPAESIPEAKSGSGASTT